MGNRGTGTGDGGREEELQPAEAQHDTTIELAKGHKSLVAAATGLIQSRIRIKAKLDLFNELPITVASTSTTTRLLVCSFLSVLTHT